MKLGSYVVIDMSSLTYEIIPYNFLSVRKTKTIYWTLNSNTYFKELIKNLKQVNLSKRNTNEVLILTEY